MVPFDKIIFKPGSAIQLVIELAYKTNGNQNNLTNRVGGDD